MKRIWGGDVLAVMRAVGMICAAAALLACDEAPEREGEKVVMGGKTFWLEPALDNETRLRGLAGREEIPEDGGMLFVFPREGVLEFVMRDCLVDIDIAFLDNSGRVTATHTMEVEPRKEGESDREYEMRLKRYSSRYAARFAVEVRAGTLEELGVEPGDRVELDLEGLKARVR